MPSWTNHGQFSIPLREIGKCAICSTPNFFPAAIISTPPRTRPIPKQATCDLLLSGKYSTCCLPAHCLDTLLTYPVILLAGDIIFDQEFLGTLEGGRPAREAAF